MLAPASHGFDNGQLNPEYSDKNSMYLGQWRNHISNKLNPLYFNQLVHVNYSPSFNSQNFDYSIEEFSFQAPVFSQSNFSDDINDSEVYFSFATQSLNATPFAVSQFISGLSPQAQFSKSKTNHQVVQQDYYAPSYTLSRGKSSFGLGFVLVQQRFLDDSFGSVTYAISSPSSISEDSALLSTNRGTGYTLSFKQELPANISVSVNYQNKIEMNEFDLFGQSYSDPGDFDIPSHYAISFDVPFLDSNNINVMAEKIDYSQIDSPVHSGYSQAFLNAFNSPISPIFQLDDLTVYSMHYEKNINKTTAVNFGVYSRQQAPAVANIYNNILKNDTASMSYKIGVSHQMAVGELNFFTSFANKPIMIGSTDFGRFSSSTLDRHLEGVLSWNLQF